MLVAGCVSEKLSIVYVLSFYYNNTTVATQQPTQSFTNATQCDTYITNGSATLAVRVGYFGTCLVWKDATSHKKPLTCSTRLDTLTSDLCGTSADPLDLLSAAKEFQKSSIFSGLIFISIALSLACCILLLIYRRWLREWNRVLSVESVEISTVPKPFDARHYTAAALGCIAFASVFSLVSALWQHLSAAATVSMVKALGGGYARAQIGTVAMVLGWGGTTLFCVTMIALLMVLLHIRMANSETGTAGT